MKESKMSRRNFLKAGALASAVGMMAAAPVAANAAAPTAVQAEDEENGMLDVFGKNADGKDVSDSVCLRKPE